MNDSKWNRTRRAGRRSGSARSASRWWLPALAVALLALPACDGLLNVTNPNQLVEEDLDDPAVAPSLVNGTAAVTARAWSRLVFMSGAASDELQFVGSREAVQRLDQGYLQNPNNEITDAAFPYVAEARWYADEAVSLLEDFDEEGRLAPHRSELAWAYFYGGLVYQLVADHYDDFVLSDRQDEAPPVGRDDMVGLYDEAVERLDRSLEVARQEGDGDAELAALAARARARHARGVWEALEAEAPGGGSVPLVADETAAADARAFFAAGGSVDWAFTFEYSQGTLSNYAASWVNNRREMRIGDEYAVPSESGNRIEGIHLEDPIDGVVSPPLEKAAETFTGADEFAPLTVLSGRELLLILAEDALAREDGEGFAQELDRLRSADGLSPYDGADDAVALLEHSRRTNLFLQGRRLADHYRFRSGAPEWVPGSDATEEPGTFFPIAAVEVRANCHLHGAC